MAAAEETLDLVFLDLGLPDLDGTEVIRRIRSFSDVPIIVLSVRDRQSDKVDALDAGADDYVTKPFGVEEVLARLRAAVRRSQPGEGSPATLVFDGLEIDLGRRLVTAGGERVHLTKTEYALLEALATNPGKLLTHQWLLRRVWGVGYGEESHYLRVYVRALRRKLGDQASAPRLILTEPGVGLPLDRCAFGRRAVVASPPHGARHHLSPRRLRPQEDPPRTGVHQCQAGAHAPAQVAGPARLRLRRPVLGRVRHGGDLHPAVDRQPGVQAPRDADLDRHRGADGDRRRLLSTDRARVPDGRRRVSGHQGEPRDAFPASSRPPRCSSTTR